MGKGLEAARLGNPSTESRRKHQQNPKMAAEKRAQAPGSGRAEPFTEGSWLGHSPGSSQGWGAQSPQSGLGVGLREGRSLRRVSAGELKIK